MKVKLMKIKIMIMILEMKLGNLFIFIKFIDIITPPVNGYYFKYQYNVKIIIHILDQDKIFKSEIDFFDEEAYIQKMKTLLFHKIFFNNL